LLLLPLDEARADVTYSLPSGFGWRKSVPLHLIKEEAVVSDLGLSADVAHRLQQLQAQIEKEVEAEILKTLKGGPYESPAAVPFPERQNFRLQKSRVEAGTHEILHSVRNAHAEELRKLLTPEQQERLHQIYLRKQPIGAHALSDPAIAMELGLTDTQRLQIRRIHEEIQQAEIADMKGRSDGWHWRARESESREQIMYVLSVEQRARFQKLKGTPLRRAKPYSQQEKVIEEIKELGGMISAGGRDESVDLSNTKKNDAVFDKNIHLYESVSIGVDLSNTNVNDVWLSHLKELDKFNYPDRGGTRVTTLHLRSLDLHGTRITDAGLASLKDLISLYSLNLRGTQITDAGLASLKDLTWLHILNLRGTRITGAGLASLKDLTHLEGLDLSETEVTEAGLEQLKGLSNLCYLQLVATHIDDAGIDRIRAAFPKIWIANRDDEGNFSLLGIQCLDSQTAAHGSVALNGSLESPDGKIALKGTRLYDQATGNPVGRELSEWRYAFVNERYAARCLAVSRDGKFVAIGAVNTVKGDSNNGRISVWEISTGRRVATYSYSTAKEATNVIGPVKSVGFSEDGKTVYYSAAPYRDIDSGR
jgi:hypothetical protein